MNTNFDYNNFFNLLDLTDNYEKETKIKELIDNHHHNNFFGDDRRWFNTLIQKGLINLVCYCERTIPYFSLYNKKEKPDHFSNVSFLWAIESGCIDTLNYFFNHPDFYLFCKSEKLEKDIASFSYRIKESKNFTFKNYTEIIDLLVQKFPFSIPEILEKNILSNKNDESTDFIISFIQKYQPYLHNYLFEIHEEEDNYTRFFMVSLNHNSIDFSDRLKKMYPDKILKESLVSFYMCYRHELHTLNFMLDNPNYFQLQEKHFSSLFKQIFNNLLSNKITKEKYQYFFKVTKHNLYTVTYDNYENAITSNFTPFVKKYYKNFQDSSFEHLRFFDNTCTHFIEKQLKEKNYKNLLNKLPEKGISVKKLKI